MSSDCKSELMQSISMALVKIVDSETASLIQDVILVKMNDYDVSKRSTAIVTTDQDQDEAIIKNFFVSLIIEGKSKKTLYQYERSIRRLLDFVGKRCLTINSTDIRAWLGSMKLSGVKNVTLSNQFHNISTFFRWMRVEKIRADDPCEAVGSIKVPKEEKKAFTSEEIDTIRSICNVQERAIIELLLSSGIRINELCNLEVRDIDFDNLTLRVRCGKGGKDRTTFISPVCKKHLMIYLKQKKTESAHVISKDYDGTGYTTDGLGGVLRNMSRRCNIHIHAHKFRRTLATDLARKGMPIQEIRIILGHSNIAVTQRYIDTELSQAQASYKQLVA